jgi:hypothetical protein
VDRSREQVATRVVNPRAADKVVLNPDKAVLIQAWADKADLSAVLRADLSVALKARVDKLREQVVRRDHKVLSAVVHKADLRDLSAVLTADLRDHAVLKA